ncbi:MAG TPA: nucleotidyltransferase family protein, partial [Cyclobacteriaceae bacterium]|nr:nucleotidyltransferase family protein [Cyclobacteriaceae bacterium]
MGASKQLLKWKDGTLLSHAVKTAMDSKAGRVYVVLGSNADTHRKAIATLPITIVVNNDWNKGMGSSLKAGVAVAKQNSESILVMTCDMPFVTSQHLNNLIKTDGDVVASEYGDAVGVPALFSKEIFPDLLLIDDAEGAKKIISRHNPILVKLDTPADLDTPEDYQKAISAN